MQVALTERFLEDLQGLQPGLAHKCRDILSQMRKMDPQQFREHAVAGWRLHKLKTSPFHSLSLDMNFRVLAKIEGDVVFVHRVVKHDLADEDRINRSDKASPSYPVGGSTIQAAEVHDALLALGLPPEDAAPFKNVVGDDDFLTVLTMVSGDVATYALGVYETTGLVLPRTRFAFLHEDDDLARVLSGTQADWNIYLHPSQQHIVDLPVDFRVAVTGSAGVSGGAVCASNGRIG